MMKVISDVDTRGFDAFIENAVGEIDDPKAKRGFVRAIMLKFQELVVPRTPVDTGRARAGWTLRKSGPDGSYGRIRTSPVGANGEMFNGVPYITYLELGSSQQAPSGFVRLTLREMSGQAAKDGERRTEAALRRANIKARREAGVRQGIGRRPGSGRYNLGRR